MSTQQSTQSLRFIEKTQVVAGMVNSMGQEIISVRHTPKSVILTTISLIDGKPMDERITRTGMIAVQA